MPGLNSSHFPHQKFVELGSEAIRAFGDPNGHVVYDLKYVLDKCDSDLRL